MKKITSFWNYFQKNEQAIKNAFLLGINTEEVFFHFERKLNYISKRIGYSIIGPAEGQEKSTITFTGLGYRKLFPKIMALENQAPRLEHFTAQAFIKPMHEITTNDLDCPFVYDNYEIRITEIQMALMDYNVFTKQIKINIYLPYYDELKQYEDLKSNVSWIVMQIVGEIAFRKHIKQIQLNQLPFEPNGLLSLMELPDFIDYLYKINSRKKTRQV